MPFQPSVVVESYFIGEIKTGTFIGNGCIGDAGFIVVLDLGHNVYGTVHFRFGVGDAHGRADEGNGNKTR